MPGMTMHARIVIFGRDPVLLETRHRILEKAGLASTAVSNFGQVISLAQQDDVSLLVLCSSLDKMETGAVLSAVQQDRFRFDEDFAAAKQV
jgi:DNA-binding response OmpR family regulator